MSEPSSKAPAFPYRAKFHPSRTGPCFCGSGRRFKACCGSQAPNRALPHGIGLIRGFLDSETCKRWIEVLEVQERKPAKVVARDPGSDGAYAARVDARRTAQVEPGPLKEDICAQFAVALRGPVAEATGRTFEFMERPQLLRYQPGDHFATHADSERYEPDREAWLKVLDRDISLLLYLNEEFSGGPLEFTHFGYRHQPRTGDLIWFPSDSRYMHRAHPVEQGVRWVIACWAAFKDEPRVKALPETRIEL